MVNPLGTVTTRIDSPRESMAAVDEFAEEYSSGAYIHENCDESMFRPYVAVISGSIDGESQQPHEKPEPIGQKLIVPVIDSSQLAEQQNREKSRMLEMKRQQDENVAKFEQMSLLNRKEKNSEKSEPKELAKKTDYEKKLSKANKEPEKKNENIEKKSGNDNEEVTVKLKKKANKAQPKSSEPSAETDEVGKKSNRKTKTSMEQSVSEEFSAEIANAISEKVVECEPVEEFVAPKPMKSKKKSPTESSSSKESSVEKELKQTQTATAGTKSKKKKKKTEAPSMSNSSSEDTKGSSACEIVKGSKSNNDSRDENPFLFEDIEKVDGAQCAEIQESLLKNSVSATVSIRKCSMKEKLDDSETSEPKRASKSGKKKKGSKESIEIGAIVLNSPSTDEPIEFTFPDPSESVADLDNLSFKSTIDDQISMIPFESIQNDVEWSKERTIDYDKLSDDAETGSGAQYSDCKSFQLIIDEPESYMRTSDTNSSDETEDSSQSKSTKSSEKTVDEDDEELQPLICSTASDAAVDLSNLEALPNQSDSSAQPETSEQSQPQPQKPATSNNNNNNNKKKFKKKRR